MKLLFTLLTVSFLFLGFKPGSGTAFLKGVSNSGKTEFYAELGDIVGTLEKATLEIDKSEFIYSSDESNIIIDPEIGVLTMHIEDNQGNYKFLDFWSIPNSFKIIYNDRGHKLYTFNAKIRGTDPRSDSGERTPTITLKCTLSYKI